MSNLIQKVNNTFIKGLITEAGELTFPENASVAESNCELFRDGSRRRRKAIVFEDNYTLSSFAVRQASVMSFGNWDNVGNTSVKNYQVIQVGSQVHFYTKSGFPFSSSEVANYVDLEPYEVAGTVGAAATKCQFASVLGGLVIVSEAIEPIYVEETDEGVFTVSAISCRIRDFETQGTNCREGYAEGVPLADITNGRLYDTKNFGWSGELGDDALNTYTSSESEYPPLTHRWYSGKNADGNFSVSEWQKVYSGTSIIKGGHFILDLFNRDRSSVSGISGFEVESEASRFRTCTSFSGRVFFSGLTGAKTSSKIYYSAVLEDTCSLGDFYQANDPTSEQISDVLESDGGVIVIPSASNIKKLYAFRNSIFVFAENGVWQIKGVDNVFKPTNYSVSKITEMGIAAASSLTIAEGVPFWWSRHGIHTLQFDDFGEASEQNLSIDTIQTFWNNVDSDAKSNVIADYDKVNKKIIWLYPSNNEPVSNKYNEVLILDVILQAFYPWTIEDKPSDVDYVVGMSFYSGFGYGAVDHDVILSTGDDVVLSNGDDVVSTRFTSIPTNAISIVFFVRDSSENKLTMATMTGGDFKDWGVADYTSYAETGYDFLGDTMTRKSAPYVAFFLRETETGWAGDSEQGYTPIGASALNVTTYWDFKKNPSSMPQQVYRRRQPLLVDEDSLSFVSPSEVVSSKIKVRGNGRSLRFRIESESGKDFIYLGHSLIADVSNRF